MATDFDEFYKEFFQEIHAGADAGGRYAEDAFFELFTSYLIDSGELDTADRAQYLGARGVRIDGYGGDPAIMGGVLSLIIADFHQSQEVETLVATEMDAIFKRALNFVTKSLDREFREGLEETSPGFGLADLIATRWSDTQKVRIFLISNRLLSSRVDGRPAGEINGVPVAYSVWDIGRLHRLVASGKAREEIEVDLVKDFGGPLPALPAHLTGAGYEAYLLVVPGPQLAAIYDRWGARLLEQNVRVFLQARGDVNKGIRNTIEHDPLMFFAYNNGITATAESATVKTIQGTLQITSMHNLQIVNGGQTTASIHAASMKKEIDLSKVFVQMKLSIVNPERAMEVVPKISEYANSQNKVNAADFFANHPFHVRMEGFSRRMFVPSPDGTFREAKWFYERARGQYQDARTRMNATQRKKFDLEYPKHQLLTKTDLAKILMLWRGFPEIVSRGAQKNFGEFAKWIGGEWTKEPDAFNEDFYRQMIAKAIIFKGAEKLVSEQDWYEGGYRANIVAYAISKIAHDSEALGRAVDFEAIWRNQALSEPFSEALKLSAKAVQESITKTPAGVKNVTEWAKSQACWTGMKETELDWPRTWLKQLISKFDQKSNARSAVKDQKILNGIEAQTAVLRGGAELWRNLHQWGMQRSLLTPTEAGVLEVASKVPTKLPSEKQSLIVINVLSKLQKEGCQLKLDS
jgi:hypothetical protein